MLVFKNPYGLKYVSLPLCLCLSSFLCMSVRVCVCALMTCRQEPKRCRMEKGEQETEGAHGGGIWHLSNSRVGGGLSASPPPLHPSLYRPRVTQSPADTEVVMIPWHLLGKGGRAVGQPRRSRDTHIFVSKFVWREWWGWGRVGGRFVCAVCSSSVQKCQLLGFCFLFFPASLPLLRLSLQGPGWRKVSWHSKVDKQTNKQTEGIKIKGKKKTRADENVAACFGCCEVDGMSQPLLSTVSSAPHWLRQHRLAGLPVSRQFILLLYYTRRQGPPHTRRPGVSPLSPAKVIQKFSPTEILFKSSICLCDKDTLIIVETLATSTK